MSKPIKQHYIPISYLKNFSECKGKGKCYTDVYILKDEVLRSNIPIKTICYQKNLYTLKSKNDEKRFALELFYANNIDAEFPKIYKLLIDKKTTVISKEEKLHILNVCLSLYFRTPKKLNHNNDFTDAIFDRIKLYADKNEIVKTKMFGDKEEYHISELEGIKAETKEKAKINFQITHLKQWMEFVKYKYECTIKVVEIQDEDASLITSDNPVIIRESHTTQFNGLFNPNNIITMPLDRKHYLEIQPNTLSNNEYEIHRYKHDRDYVVSANAITEGNAENLLIGYNKTLKCHFELQKEYEGSYGNKSIDKATYIAQSLALLLKLINEKGMDSKETMVQLKLIYHHPYLKGNQEVEIFVNHCKENGWW
ncbi:DUF4238 domain-containing protein [Arenibacter sp. N53]|uniref:DUF4238 domain-containing protein n=1 Tax=Arenibacter TaxID=178469 RepID=UPI000CD3B53D|nr:MULTISPECIES: DUF4238 domain-containing protein [Arenibacter]MCM4153544.1 DUF4238 domain-containing protein [Arenibacter sp. N53]